MTSQIADTMATPSAPQDRRHRRAPVAEHGNDDGQADGHLSRGDHHHEKHGKLAFEHPSSRPAATKVRLTEFSISSIDMNMTRALRRTSSPTAPMANSPAARACTSLR